MRERDKIAVFWCNYGLALEVVISWRRGGIRVGIPIWGMGDVGDKVGCKETGGENDWPGVVEDEVNGGGVERKGSLVDEGSSEEEGVSGWGFVGDIGYGEVGGEGERAWATGEEEGGG